MTKIFYIGVFISIFLSFSAHADEKKDASWIKREAYKVAKNYAESIACDTRIEEKNLIPLNAWGQDGEIEDRGDAKYALIWHGDIGCNGGSGSHGWYIAIIQIGAGNNFFVNVEQSSPMIQFQVPGKPDIDILKVSKNSLLIGTVEEVEIDEKNCCKYVNVQIRLKEDKKGNWVVASKKLLN